MKTLAISVFKANALKIIDEVSKFQESVVITKRGKAIAELIPFRASKNEAQPGRLASTLIFEKDIVSPLDSDMWEACK
ncbi:MAG: type II toxin-antitoxin system Phd/YefM family antitoxin [bacterium]